MKLFVITHGYGGDGASEMLLSAASHWTHQLGWQVDAVAVPHMTSEVGQAVADSGMRLIPRAQFQEGTISRSSIACTISPSSILFTHTCRLFCGA